MAFLQAGGDSDIKTAQGLIITFLKQNNILLLSLSLFISVRYNRFFQISSEGINQLNVPLCDILFNLRRRLKVLLVIGEVSNRTAQFG